MGAGAGVLWEICPHSPFSGTIGSGFFAFIRIFIGKFNFATWATSATNFSIEHYTHVYIVLIRKSSPKSPKSQMSKKVIFFLLFVQKFDFNLLNIEQVYT